MNLPILLLAACRGHEEPEDADHDGFTVSDGDCNDHDPSVNPDAGEISYDRVDQDCDPSNNAALLFGRIPLTAGKDHAAGPRLASGGDEVEVNLVYADGFDASSWSWATRSASNANELLENSLVFQAPDLPISLGRVMDAALRPDGKTLLALSIDDGTGVRAALMHILPNGTWGWSGYGPNGTSAPFQDVALSDDGDVVSIVGCGDLGFFWASGPLADFEVGTPPDEQHSAIPVAGCEVQGPRIRVLDRNGTVTAYTVEDGALTSGQTWSKVLDFQWEPEGMLLRRKDGLTIEPKGGDPVEVPTSDEPALARFDVAPDGEAFVVWANGAGDLWLSYGPLEGPFTEAFLGGGLAQSDLDVEATDDTVFVVARSQTDEWIAGTPRP